MLKATIITPYKRFDVTLPPEAGSKADSGLSWIENQIYREEWLNLPGRAINFPHTDDIRAIDVWEEPDELPAELVQLSSVLADQTGCGEICGALHFLSQPVRLRLLTYNLRGSLYVLPQEVNEGPALDALDHEHLGRVSEHLLHREGISATVILPPVQLGSDQAAYEYLMDYAEQATPPTYMSPADKTGRAARGLWDDK